MDLIIFLQMFAITKHISLPDVSIYVSIYDYLGKGLESSVSKSY